MSARVAVTGATGFLGRHVVEHLLEQGHDVVAIARTPNSTEPDLTEGATFFRGDVQDPRSMDAALAGCESVIHCAGRVSRDPADADELHALHVGGTKTVLDAAKRAGIRRAVVASTSGTVAVSENPKRILDERAPSALPIIARWPYYRTKLFAEEAALERNSASFEVVVASPTLLLGPGDFHGSSTGDVVDLLERRHPVLPGGGLSFVDARDAAVGLALALEVGQPGQRYLLAAQNLTLAEFARKIERLSGVRAPSMTLPASLGLARAGAWLDKAVSKRLGGAPRMDRVSMEMAQYFWYVDASKARRELGWEPRDPMVTLADTVNDLLARGVAWPAA
ncbi:MAG: SDR family NAD(P)-dependent oxidoreductase [Polyangiaceae bacterium]